MDQNETAKYESSYFFVCLVTGILIFIETFIFININNIEAELLSEIFTFIPWEIMIFFISYILGMFVHGIRYFGFMHYVSMYWNNKLKRERSKRKYKLPLYMKIVKYCFRNDTTIEVLIKVKKQTGIPTYKWIEESKSFNDAVDQIWPKAILVSKEVDNSVYRFLYYSEFFQCFETTFLFSSLTIFIFLVIIPCQILGAWKQNMAYLLIIIILHLLSRNIAINFSKRFFLDIDSGLRYLELKNK
jgi:uncharacterized integral membrane protein